MKGVYVVSTPEKIVKNEYKIGRHEGPQRSLLSRYKTPLIDPQICYFHNYDDYVSLETAVLSKLDKYRIKDNGGKKTEWVILDIIEIISTIQLCSKEKSTTKNSQSAKLATKSENIEGNDSNISIKKSNVQASDESILAENHLLAVPESNSNKSTTLVCKIDVEKCLRFKFLAKIIYEDMPNVICYQRLCEIFSEKEITDLRDFFYKLSVEEQIEYLYEHYSNPVIYEKINTAYCTHLNRDKTIETETNAALAEYWEVTKKFKPRELWYINSIFRADKISLFTPLLGRKVEKTQAILRRWLEEYNKGDKACNFPPMTWRQNRDILVNYPLANIGWLWDEYLESGEIQGVWPTPDEVVDMKNEQLKAVLHLAIAHKGQIKYGIVINVGGAIGYRSTTSACQEEYIELYMIEADWVLSQSKNPGRLEFYRQLA